jgi:hypothetical protein
MSDLTLRILIMLGLIAMVFWIGFLWGRYGAR